MHRACPQCAELILLAARKCKHCGSEVEPIQEEWSGAKPPEIITEYEPPPRKPSSSPLRIALAVFVVLIVVLGARGVMMRTPPTSPVATSLPAPKPLSAAERIAEAEKLVKDKNPTPETMVRAKLNLQGIPKEAPEAKRAAVLMDQANAIHKKLSAELETLKNPVIVVSDSWKKGGFGSIGIWSVTFENRSNQRVGDLAYETEYYSESGNRVGRKSDVIQKVIEPKSKRTIEVNDGFIHSEARSANFELKGWRFVP
jgi:RNA polymerase subunit RPABC4/transcription elongation factor Spt4